jgi:shikimate dehydrogenase
MGVPYAEVIGDPVAHSKSPLIHKFWLEKLGMEGDYRATRVGGQDLAAYLKARQSDPSWRGCNVTAPLKQTVLPLIDSVDSLAGRIGAANTLVRREGLIEGFNTDASGFLEPLSSTLTISADRGPAIVLGAGGAARAVVFALAGLGLEPLILNRDPVRARALAVECGGAWFDDLSIYDLLANPCPALHSPPWPGRAAPLLVNATPLGMTGKPPLDISLEAVDTDAIVYDLIYSPLETPLLAEARQRGMTAISGLKMLVGQAGRAFGLFFGVEAPRQHDEELWGLLSQ